MSNTTKRDFQDEVMELFASFENEGYVEDFTARFAGLDNLQAGWIIRDYLRDLADGNCVDNCTEDEPDDFLEHAKTLREIAELASNMAAIFQRAGE